MNRIISLVILGLFLFVTVDTSFAAPVWCGYNDNAKRQYANNEYGNKRNQIQDSLTVCTNVNAPAPMLSQLKKWVDNCDAATKNNSTDTIKIACKKDYECIKLQSTGNPCFTPGYQGGSACGSSINTVFRLGTGCVACPSDKPLLNKTTLVCEACPANAPFYNTATLSCVACDASTPFWDASSNSCKACSGATPKYDASNNACVASGCSGTTPLYNKSNQTCVACPATKPKYNASTNTCVASGCTTTTPFYNTTTKACEACPSTTPVYTATTNQCSACPKGTTYDATQKSCVTPAPINTGAGNTGSGGTGSGGTGSGGTGSGGTGSGGTGSGGTGSGGTGSGGGSPSNIVGNTPTPAASVAAGPTLEQCKSMYSTMTSVYAMKVEISHTNNQLGMCKYGCPGGVTADSLTKKLVSLKTCCKVLNGGTDCPAS